MSDSKGDDFSSGQTSGGWGDAKSSTGDQGWSKTIENGGAKGLTDSCGGFADSVTETSTRGWFSRIGGAFTGLLVGLILIPGACWLLFWNEGRAVHTARALSEGGGSVVSVAADRPDAAREGRLVHVTGPLASTATLSDGDTGVTVQGAVALRRQVEMYQWRESSSSSTTTNLGGSQTTQTTYSYNRVWSDTAIDSGRFRQSGGHANPAMPIAGRSIVAPEARLGGFRLAEPQLRLLPANEALPVDGATLRPVAGRRTQASGQGIYVGGDPSSPSIGDLRITYQVARPASASVIARQVGDGFAPYATSNGETLQLVSAGTKTAAEMIQQAEEENAVLGWILRAVGVVLVFVGFALIFQPIRVLADVVPIFGTIVGFGTGLLAGVLTLIVAPVVIAVAWFAYRPILAAIVLAVGAALAFGLSRLRRARRPAAAVPAMPAR
jgi:Transmembrane protein 43